MDIRGRMVNGRVDILVEEWADELMSVWMDG